MTAFSNLPAEIQTMFTVLLFIAFVGEIHLMCYKLFHKAAGKTAASAVFLLILAALLILLA